MDESAQREREDLEARQAYEASRPSAPSDGDGGLAQDIAAMLFAFGELGDTPIPNALDALSAEDFLDTLETALQARQAVRENPLWPLPPVRSSEANLAPPPGQEGPETSQAAAPPWPLTVEGRAALEARLHASNMDRSEEIPENLLADLDDYYTRLRLWEEGG
eukprot:6484717-Amphidinium_carterae.1